MKISDLALKKEWITRDQFRAVRSLLKQGDPRRLELVLLQKNWISQSQMFDLLQESLFKLESLSPQEKNLLEDVLLAKRAIQKKWLSSRRLFALFRHQLELLSEGLERRFLDMAVFEGLLTEVRRDALEEDVHSRYFLCPSCSMIIPLDKIKKQPKFQCPRCKGVFKNEKNRTSQRSHSSVRAIKTALSLPVQIFVDPFEKTDKKDRYEVREKIGQGGIGAIYQIYDRDLHRVVALKVIRQDKNYSERSLRRFIEEARVLARLEHPNIVPVHSIGYTGDGRPYFTMKYVRGRSLSEVMEKLRKEDEFLLEEFSVERLLQIFLSICQAITFSHAQGVLHRDLKPANIMLGAFGEVLVMDWGLAKLKEKEEQSSSTYGDMIDLETNPAETSQGRMVGTVHYVPPEQILNQPGDVDERSDIYSLGAILYEMLAFLPPFIGGTKEEIKERVLAVPPPKPSSVAKRRVPYELAAICLKALSKDKAQRYNTAQEMGEDVQNYLSNRPVLAAEAGPLIRLLKWFKRNKLILIMLGTIFTVVLLLSPLMGFAYKAALIGTAVIVAAVYTLVFYDEARRRALQLERKLKSSEQARRDLEAALSRMERQEG